jgi:hypothetical protein
MLLAEAPIALTNDFNSLVENPVEPFRSCRQNACRAVWLCAMQEAQSSLEARSLHCPSTASKSAFSARQFTVQSWLPLIVFAPRSVVCTTSGVFRHADF